MINDSTKKTEAVSEVAPIAAPPINPVASGKPYPRARLAFAGAIALQLTVIGTMASVSTYTLCVGETVQIKTKVVDPWDMFRGDYVTLNYDTVTPDAATTFRKDDTIYVTARRQGQFVIPERAFGRMPNVDHSKYVVLRGKLDMGGYKGSPIYVKYGIERFYIPERTGSRFDGARQLVASVAVDNFGHCVLKDVTPVPAVPPAK